MIEAIDIEQVERLLRDDDAQLVEVLPAAEYEEEHLPGAVSIPLKELGERAGAELDPERPVIVYCWDWLCDMSPRAAARLAGMGVSRVHDYAPGKVDWTASGRPTEGAPRPLRLGDLVEPGATCRFEESVGHARRRLGDRGPWWVIDDRGVLVGRIDQEARLGADGVGVDEVMAEGPVTHRANDQVARVLEGRSRASTFVVTTPRGVLLGTVDRERAARALSGSRPARGAGR